MRLAWRLFRLSSCACSRANRAIFSLSNFLQASCTSCKAARISARSGPLSPCTVSTGKGWEARCSSRTGSGKSGLSCWMSRSQRDLYCSREESRLACWRIFSPNWYITSPAGSSLSVTSCFFSSRIIYQPTLPYCFYHTAYLPNSNPELCLDSELCIGVILPLRLPVLRLLYKGLVAICKRGTVTWIWWLVPLGRCEVTEKAKLSGTSG